MQYLLVSEIGSKQFQVVVNQALINGWKPLGGVSLAIQPIPDGVVFWYSQAFTR